MAATVADMRTGGVAQSPMYTITASHQSPAVAPSTTTMPPPSSRSQFPTPVQSTENTIATTSSASSSSHALTSDHGIHYLSPQTVNVSAHTPHELGEAVRAVQMAYYIDPPPKNWTELMLPEDTETCFNILRNLITIHHDQNDHPSYTEVRREQVDKYPPQHALASRNERYVASYELMAFGIRKPITDFDMSKLKLTNSLRIIQVYYDSQAQATDPQYKGALVIRVSSFQNERERELAHASMPPPPVHFQVPAVPAAATTEKKRRRFSLVHPSTWFNDDQSEGNFS